MWAVQWNVAHGQVAYMELAPNFPMHAHRALLVAPGHKSVGRPLLLHERARLIQLLKLTFDTVQRFMHCGELLKGRLQ